MDIFVTLFIYYTWNHLFNLKMLLTIIVPRCSFSHCERLTRLFDMTPFASQKCSATHLDPDGHSVETTGAPFARIIKCCPYPIVCILISIFTRNYTGIKQIIELHLPGLEGAGKLFPQLPPPPYPPPPQPLFRFGAGLLFGAGVLSG